MQKLVRFFIFLFVVQSFAYAQQQNFMVMPDQWEVSLIQWTRTGNSAAGKYFRNWIDADYDVNRTQANVFATIKGSDVVLNISGTVYNSKLVKTGLSISVKNNDGTISNAVFQSVQIETYNKNVQALNTKAAQLKARAVAIAKAEEQATLLNGEINELLRTSEETTTELKEFQAALQKFLVTPTSFYSDQQSGATAMKGLLQPLNRAERAFSDLSGDVDRKDCDYMPDIQRRQKILETVVSEIQAAPNSSETHLKIVETLYRRASERLALAATQLNRLTALVTREQITYKPTNSLVGIQNAQKNLESINQLFRAFLNTFDANAKAAVTKKIQTYLDEAAKLIATLNCPAK